MPMFKLNCLFLGLISVSLSACSQNDQYSDQKSAQITEGKALVAENCLECHSLSAANASPHELAPALNKVLENYNPNSLTDDFREGVHVGHPDMPDFDFGVKGTDEIIAYLKDIQSEK